MSSAIDDELSRLILLSTANIGDAMDRLGILDSGIKPIWPCGAVVGHAFTVWTHSGDNLFVHDALDQLGEGSVLVVNGQGDASRSLVGSRMAAKAKLRGCRAIVVDGAVRDAAGLQAVGVPVFARAISPAGPYRNGPGRLSVPIAVGGVVVQPGDIVFGDSDGVAVIPRAQLGRTAARAEAIAISDEQPLPLRRLSADDIVAPLTDGA